MSSPSVAAAAEAPADEVSASLTNLFRLWSTSGCVLDHDGTLWRPVNTLRRIMSWTHGDTELRWNDLGTSQPRWCCSRCETRGPRQSERYVTREGALRMLMESPSECEGFWRQLLPNVHMPLRPLRPAEPEEPDAKLQVYSVVIRTMNQGFLCPFELREFATEMKSKGLAEHIRGRFKDSDYFKNAQAAAAAVQIIKSRTWTTVPRPNYAHPIIESD